MKKINCLLAVAFFALNCVNAQTLTLQPSATDGYEGIISSPYPTQASTEENIVAAYWTANGNPGAWRSFFKFDLAQLPSGIVLDSAFLSLYADLNSTFGTSGAPTTGTDNSGQICRVTTAWNKATMNWNNQPPYTTSNAVTLAQSLSDVQDYLDINVTDLVADMMVSGNNGFMIKMINEANYYNSLIFHSSHSTTANKRPKLFIKYHLKPTDIGEVERKSNVAVQLFPNPCKDYLNINVSKLLGSEANIVVYNQAGQIVATKVFTAGTSKGEWRLELKGFAKGIYIVNVLMSDVHVCKSFVVY